jgi:hypothetical protein
MRQINFSIEDRVFVTLEKSAASHGYKATSYAKMLFEAAFAARVGVQPNAGLDAQIGMALVMRAAKQDTANIAAVVGLSEATVVRILDAWRDCRAGVA